MSEESTPYTAEYARYRNSIALDPEHPARVEIREKIEAAATHRVPIHSEWVPVEDSLPNASREVWIFSDQGYSTGFYDFEESSWREAGSLFFPNVTHWAEIVEVSK